MALENHAQVRVAADEAERALLWKGRKSAFGAVAQAAPNYYLHDTVVPRTKLVETMEEVYRIGDKHGLTMLNVFHAGDGNLHPLMAFDAAEPGMLEKVQAAADELVELCVNMGGALSGEHGIGREKRDLMPLMFNSDRPRCPGSDQGGVRPHRGVQSRQGPARSARGASTSGASSPRAPGCDLDRAGSPSGLENEGRRPGAPRCRHHRGAIQLRPIWPHSWPKRRPAASGSWCGAAAAIRVWVTGYSPDLVVSTSRLNRLIAWEPDDMTVVVEGGMGVADLEARLATRGQTAVLPEIAGDAATVGGVLAAGISGYRRARYGPTRDRILEITVVTGDGRIVKAGGRVVKNVTGYDLPRLVVGSFGALGVVVSACLKLWPLAGCASATITLGEPAVRPAWSTGRWRFWPTSSNTRVFLAGTEAEVDSQAARLDGSRDEGLAWPSAGRRAKPPGPCECPRRWSTPHLSKVPAGADRIAQMIGR